MARPRRRRRRWRRCTLMDMGRKPFTEAAKERRRSRTMEALVPPGVLDVGDDDNHTARSSNSAVPTTNYDAIAVPTTNSEQQFAACSLEWSTTAPDCLPQSRSSLARTAPTRGDGGQCAPGQRATTRQRAIPRQWAPGQRATTGQRATPRQCATPQRTSEHG